MSDNQLAKVTAGKTGFAQQVNQFVDSLTVNFLPRSLAGTVVDLAGSIGEQTRRWVWGFFENISIRGASKEMKLSEDGFDYSDGITFVNGTNENARAGENFFTPKTRSGITFGSGGDSRKGEITQSSGTILSGTTAHFNFGTWNHSMIAVNVRQEFVDAFTLSMSNASELIRIAGKDANETLILYKSTSDLTKTFSINNPTGSDGTFSLTIFELH